MKFFVNCNDLSAAVTTVSRALTNKKNIPVLEGIKIVANSDGLTLTATDLDLFIEKRIKAEVFVEGEVVVPGKFFAEYIRKLTGYERVEFDKLDNRHLLCTYCDGNVDFQCFEEDTYPEVVQVDDNYSFKIKEKELRDLLEKTIYAVAVDDSRPILKGCCIETKEGKVTAVGLDGYRIAICRKPITEQKGDVKIIVPGKNLNEISKIFEDNDNNVIVDVQESYVKFDLGHTVIISRLLEGSYVNYEKIIPSEFKTVATIKVSDFVQRLERSSLIARSLNNNSVKMEIGNNQIKITANSQNASAAEVVVANIEGMDITIAFNSKYLQEAMTRVTEDYVRIEMMKSNAPAVIKQTDGTEYQYIILPVRQIG